jgi:hypothetical protein
MSDNKNSSYLKGLKEHLKEKINFYEKQIVSSNQFNRTAKLILNSSNYEDQTSKHLARLNNSITNEKRNSFQTSKINSKRPIKQARTTRDLINYVKLRQTYMQHENYWHQVWLFTENPLFEFGSEFNGKLKKK